jgi:hypothetical protein
LLWGKRKDARALQHHLYVHRICLVAQVVVSIISSLQD